MEKRKVPVALAGVLDRRSIAALAVAAIARMHEPRPLAPARYWPRRRVMRLREIGRHIIGQAGWRTAEAGGRARGIGLALAPNLGELVGEIALALPHAVAKP